jgi:hypothetical protein
MTIIMNKKFYALFVLLSVCFIPLSILAQTCPGESRAVTDCKAGTNDRIGAVLKDFFMDGSTATWNFEAGSTWRDNADGTATLTGVLSHYANPTDRRMTLNVTFNNRTTTPPPGSPVLMNTPGISIAGWQYFDWSTATLTGVAGTHMAGAQLTLAKRDKAFQLGTGAADQVGEQTQNGGTGWFSWTIVSQPSNGWLVIKQFPANPSIDQGDLCIRVAPCAGGGGSTLTLTCGNNITVTAAAGATGAIVNYSTPSVSTTCPTGGATVTRTSGPASGSSFPIGTTQVCFRATDNCGNEKTCCFSITVNSGGTGCDNVTNGGTISKSCSNGVITLSGTAPTGGSGALEYQWLKATNSCPTSLTQVIAGATNASLTVTASSITATTYYVRCVRRAGCTDANSWVPGESNCISITPGECPTTGGGNCTKYTVGDANDCVGGSWAPYGVWIASTNYRFLTGAMFQKNADGTATLMGNISLDGWSVAGSVNATFSGMTTTPPSGSPKFSSCTQGASAAGWMYYTAISGTITRNGQVQTLAIRGAAFQVGIGANWQNAGDLGASGWYTLNGSIEGDFNIRLSNPVDCGGGDPCATDATPPSITCPANIVKTATGTGTCWTVSWTAPTATDNCPGAVSVTQTSGPANGSCFAIGTKTIVYKATDAKGNTATCSFTVTINPPVDPCATDVTPPSITCPANIVKTATGTGTCWTVSWTAPTATDNCPGAVSVTQTSGPANGSCFAIGTKTIVYKATDAKGNTATCSFTVTINPPVDPCATDVTPPSITCPANIVKTATGTGTCWTVSWTAPTATDNCPGAVSVTQTSGPANGSCFAIGTKTIVYKATDAKGNTATCSFTVTINPAVDPCQGIVSVRPITNTKNNCNTGVSYVALWNNVFYTAGSNLVFTEYTNGTATIKGNVHANGATYTVNATLTGRTCTSAGSPKLGDGNGVCGPNGMNTTNWYYYTGLSGTMTTAHGTINLTRNGPAFQVGNFANLQQNVMGASGWFNGNGESGGDFNFNLGNCTSCCSGQPAISCNNPTNCDGSIVVERWYSMTWNFPITIPGGSPNITEHQGNTQGPWDIRDNYTSRARGYIIPSTTGNHTFNITGDDNVEFFLSGSSSPSGMSRRAYIHGWTGANENHKYSSQTSSAIHLVAGQRYYFELRHTEGTGGDGWKIFWKTPTNSTWQIIPSQNLARPCSNTFAKAGTSIALSMDAQAEPNRAKIQWVNNSGFDNDFFTVEKMNLSTGEFEELEKVNTKVSDRVESYLAYDKEPAEGDNFYRIKLTFHDGSTKFSETRQLTFSNLNTIRVFPNPAYDYIDLDLKQLKGQEANIYLYNRFGQQVQFTNIEQVTDNIVRLDVSNQTTGNYLIRVSAKGKRDMTKQLNISK